MWALNYSSATTHNNFIYLYFSTDKFWPITPIRKAFPWHHYLLSLLFSWLQNHLAEFSDTCVASFSSDGASSPSLKSLFGCRLLETDQTFRYLMGSDKEDRQKTNFKVQGNGEGLTSRGLAQCIHNVAIFISKGEAWREKIIHHSCNSNGWKIIWKIGNRLNFIRAMKHKRDRPFSMHRCLHKLIGNWYSLHCPQQMLSYQEVLCLQAFPHASREQEAFKYFSIPKASQHWPQDFTGLSDVFGPPIIYHLTGPKQ